jgi:hypothetical protein
VNKTVGSGWRNLGGQRAVSDDPRNTPEAREESGRVHP